jgi:hypothetical protein
LISTDDAARVLGLPRERAGHLLQGLARTSDLHRIAVGVYARGARSEPEWHVAAIFGHGAYVSGRSALAVHGLIEKDWTCQIVSAGKARHALANPWNYKTLRVPAELHGGAAQKFQAGHLFDVASPEKAVVDLLCHTYGAAGRIRWLETPRFDLHHAEAWIDEIRDPAMRAQVRRAFKRVAAQGVGTSTTSVDALGPGALARRSKPASVVEQAEQRQGVLASRARDLILASARDGRTITFTSLADALGIDTQHLPSRKELAAALERIAGQDAIAGRPLSTSIVLSANGLPGRHVFKLLRARGVVIDDERAAARAEREDVWDDHGPR